MAKYQKLNTSGILMGKLSHNADLLDELTEICEKNNIESACIEALGAVKKARIGYYDQQKREYSYTEINKNLEITKLTGNISLKDDKPMVHAHITLADENLNCFGGHLAKGTIIFACEFVIYMFKGNAYNRTFDEQTGLTLWDL